MEQNKIEPFPKIFHIGGNSIKNLFSGEVEITEKIDGSQWGMGIDENGELVMRSKGNDLSYKDKEIPKMFEKAFEQTKRIEKILRKNNLFDIYFYCEFLSAPRHNILKYDRVPKNNLYLFGVKYKGVWISDINKLWEFADLIDVERVNLLYYGIVKDINQLEKMLETKSILGGEIIEGIVVKNYNQPAIVTQNLIFPISLGKYVSESFKEKQQKGVKKKSTSKDKLEILIESYRTEARWHKAIQHLKEKGMLEFSPRDIGKLIKEIKKDLMEEEKENIKEELFQVFKSNIENNAVEGFAEWYKKYLLKRGIETN